MAIYNNTYCVYIHRNKINNKVYIGITSKDPEKRWKFGYGYKNNVHFWSAIKTCKWENFEHIIFEEGLTKEDACKKEVLLIALYNAKNPEYGYNNSSGGEYPEWTEKSKLKMAKSLKKTIREKHKVESEINLRDRFNKNDSLVRKCIKCGTLFEIIPKKRKYNSGHKSMKQEYVSSYPKTCPDCRNEHGDKTKNIVKVCIDCGCEFICSVFATNTVRCKECNLIHQRKRNAEKNKAYRERKKQYKKNNTIGVL